MPPNSAQASFLFVGFFLRSVRSDIDKSFFLFFCQLFFLCVFLKYRENVIKGSALTTDWFFLSCFQDIWKRLFYHYAIYSMEPCRHRWCEHRVCITDENDSDGVVLVQWKGKSRNKKSHGLFTFAPVNGSLSERWCPSEVLYDCKIVNVLTSVSLHFSLSIMPFSVQPLRGEKTFKHGGLRILHTIHTLIFMYLYIYCKFVLE